MSIGISFHSFTMWRHQGGAKVIYRSTIVRPLVERIESCIPSTLRSNRSLHSRSSSIVTAAGASSTPTQSSTLNQHWNHHHHATLSYRTVLLTPRRSGPSVQSFSSSSSSSSSPSQSSGKAAAASKKSTEKSMESSRNNLAAGEVGSAHTPSNMEVLKQLLRYLWPEGEPALRARVVVSIALLLGAKVCSVYVPFMFKHAVDMLNAGVDAGNVAAALPIAALIGCQ